MARKRHPPALRLGDVLQELRKAAELHQDEVAEKAGVPLATLRKIEQGRIEAPSFQAVAKIAAVLGSSLDQLATQGGFPVAEFVEVERMTVNAKGVASPRRIRPGAEVTVEGRVIWSHPEEDRVELHLEQARVTRKRAQTRRKGK